MLKSGWGVVESDFSSIAFQNWRFKAFGFLSAVFGPDHVYTKHFEHLVRQGDRKNVQAASSMMVAIKEQIKGTELRPSKSLVPLRLREIQ